MEGNTYGYLEIILGPMFSGKTSKLIEIYKQYAFCQLDTLVINHMHDNRYSSSSSTNSCSQETQLYSHDQIHIPCVQANSLQSVIHDHIDMFTSSTPFAVFINEGQFFHDLYASVVEMVQEHKVHVYIAGLDGDFKREKFGQILDLIPLCDKVCKLHSLCVYCKNGTNAIFSYRKDCKNKQQTQIGANDTYSPVCRKCYGECS